jgi:hypothetical protein
MTKPECFQTLMDRQEICDVLARYCRAIDRRDKALLAQAYWPDAIDDHATFRGTPAEFIEYAFAHTADMITSHMIANIIIDFDGPTRAFSECYFAAYHNFPTGAGRMDRTVGGRYLDHFEKRDARWAISRRTLCIDWYVEQKATSVWDTGRYANLPARGCAKPDDPLYRLHFAGAHA